MKRKPGNGILDCVNPYCRDYTHQSNHDYCVNCKRIARQVQDNAKNRTTGEKPDFHEAMRIAARCFEIAKNPYATPDQLEWAIMILPDVYFYLYEPDNPLEEKDNDEM